MAVRDFVIKRGDVWLDVRDCGHHGPDVVLLHGWGANVGSWECVAPALATSFHVVAFDQRGHGGSSTAESYALAEWVDDLEMVLREVGADHPLLVGHSWGGRVALVYAASRRGCRGVVSIDGANTRVPEREFDLEQETARWAADPLVSFRGHGRSFERFLDQVKAEFPGHHWRTYEHILRRQFVTVDGEVRHRRTPEEMALLAEPIEGANPPVVEFYDGVDCPVLLINARDAQAAEKESNAVSITRRNPNVTTVWMDGGHDLPTERPNELVDLIATFHRDVSAT